MPLEVSESEKNLQERLALLDKLRQTEIRATGLRVASVVGHLIGTPLNVIAGRASLIRTNPSAEGALQNALKIEDQVAKLTFRVRRLIEHLNPVEPPAEKRPMHQIMSDALALYGPIATRCGVRLDVHECDSSQMIVLDGASTLVVLTALLSMAIRVAPPGENISLRCSESGGQAHLELEIPGFTLPRGRIDSMEPPDEPGGAGAEHLQVLSVCSAITRRLGGQLEVQAGDRQVDGGQGGDGQRTHVLFTCLLAAAKS
jgi:signal transduction histidine kinase